MEQKNNIPDQTDGVDEPRYERKFSLHPIDVDLVYTILKTHPACFFEIYSERRIHNIYFDTLDLQSVQQSINGVYKRRKDRIRWYGDTSVGHIAAPQYEIKKRQGELSQKFVYPLQSAHLNDILHQEYFRDSGIGNIPEREKEYMKTCIPTLYNSYTRRYFISQDKKFRVTVDTNITAIRMFEDRKLEQRVAKQVSSVLELKYRKEDDIEAQIISNAFPFRLSRNSKYVSGMYDRDTPMM